MFEAQAKCHTELSRPQIDEDLGIWASAARDPGVSASSSTTQRWARHSSRAEMCCRTKSCGKDGASSSLLSVFRDAQDPTMPAERACDLLSEWADKEPVPGHVRL